MNYEYKPSFARSLRSYPPDERDRIKTAVGSFIHFLDQPGNQLPVGLGLKRLRGDFWEIRRGLQTRILLTWRGDLIAFVVAGNHDTIKRILKQR